MKISAEEVFTIAQRAEENAVRMYRTIADKFPVEKELFIKLAGMEEQHKKTFIAMQDALDEEDRSTKSPDPFFEMQEHLAAMADTHGGEGRPAEAGHITGNEKLSEILTRAVELEKNSITFYEDIGKYMQNDSGKERLREIIKEEEDHAKVLSDLAEKYKGKETQ